MSHTILILGGGVMQLPSIRIAKRYGWNVYVADGNPSCPGASLCDRFFPIDLKDQEGLVEAAKNAQPRPTGVFTAGTDFSVSVAFVAQALHLPGTSYESALNASDKARMRRCFAEHGVPSPQYREVDSPHDLSESLLGYSFPLVVKPVDNMGARGVRRVDTKEDLSQAVIEAIRYSRTGRAIVEEFIPGSEYSIDAIVFKGEITICGVAERHIYFPPSFVEMGHTIPADIPAAVRQDVVDVFRAGVRALGITSGAAKGDIFHTGSGACVGEIAARLSGGYMSGWTYPYSSGHEVTEAALNIAVGLPPGDLSARRTWTSAERAFLSIPGTVTQISGVSAARNVPGVHDVFLRIEAGKAVRFPSNNVEKCGNVISAASDRESAVRAAQYALRCIEIRLEPNQPESDAFLFEPRAQHADPCVFPLMNSRNIDALSVLQAAGFTLDYLSTLLSQDGAREIVLPEIAPLPQWSLETALNWMGSSLADAVRTVVRRHGLSMCIDGVGFRKPFSAELAGSTKPSQALTALFWLALVRGGFQGVEYLVDSLASRMPFGINTRNGMVEV